MVVILLALIFIFQPISWTTVPKNGVLSVIIDRTDTTTADAVKKPRGVGGERVFLFGSEEGLLSAFPEVASDFTFLQTCLGTRELPRYPDSGRSEYLGR